MSSNVEANAEPAALRADAARNRDRIITAARELFAERGLDVPTDDIAKHAGVGGATLYRRFPTRDDLLSAVFAGKVTAYAAAAEHALADPDPWRGFCWFLEHLCAMQAEDRAFADLLTISLPTASAVEADRARAYKAFSKLIRQAKKTGQLRPEFTPEDLVLLLMATAGVITATADTVPNAYRRVLCFLVQSYATSHAPVAALPPAPSMRTMWRAMLRLNHSKK